MNFKVFMLFLVGIANLKASPPPSLADQIFLLRDRLFTIEVHVCWIKPEIEKSYLDNYFKTYNSVPFNLEMFQDEASVLTLNKWSEWPGDWVSFPDRGADKELLSESQRIVNQLNVSPSDLHISVQQKVSLQHDFLEMCEMYWNGTHKNGSNTNQTQYGERLFRNLLAILRILVLSEDEVKNIPKFQPIAFYNAFISKSGVSASNLQAWQIQTGILKHDIAQHYRTAGELFLLCQKNDNCIPQCFKNPTEFVAPAGSTGTAILAEYPLILTNGGKFDPQFVPLPSTVRTESLLTGAGGLHPVHYNVYRLDDRNSIGSEVSYVKLPESSSGVPMSELPNVLNPWRTQLETSCINCHGGGVRLNREDHILAPFDLNRIRQDLIPIKQKEKAFLAIRAELTNG